MFGSRWSVMIPCKRWHLCPQPRLAPAVSAMTTALVQQKHIVPITEGMPGFGLSPSAPVFVIPESAEKCSLIVNCKTGNKRDLQPQPKMRLPNMWSSRQKFVRWGSSLSGRNVPRHACTFELRNCFTSLQLPPEAWGTFRVQSPQGVYDLRTLPFGWKLSPPICQEVVGRHLGEVFDLMPPPPHLPASYRPDRDHYLDELLVVMENDPGWLRSCLQLVFAAMRGKGYQVSEKSVLEPATWVKWLGKEGDLEYLSISNTQAIVTRLIACLIVTWGRCVSKKDLMRIVGLIGWLGTPATTHLPFLGGVYCVLYRGRSEWLKVTPRLWISLLSAALIVIPLFFVPRNLVSCWRLVKRMFVYAAACRLPCGSERFRVGIYDPGGGGGGAKRWSVRTGSIPSRWQNSTGSGCLLRTLSGETMLQDHQQAIWGTVNRKSRAQFCRHNRVLTAMFLHLRNSSLGVHCVWVPSAYQPADPLSRIPYFSRHQILRASHQAALRWNDLVQTVHYLEYKGVTFVAV